MLGADEPDKAKKAMMVAISFASQLLICLQNQFLYLLVVLWSFMVAIVMSSYRRIGELFTSDR